MARNFIRVVLGDEQEKVLHARVRDGYERAQGHQHTTVAVEANDLARGLREGEAQREIGGVSDGTVAGGEVQRMRRIARPGAHGRHRRYDDRVFAPPRERLEELMLGELHAVSFVSSTATGC